MAAFPSLTEHFNVLCICFYYAQIKIMAEDRCVYDSLEADAPAVRTIGNLNRLHRFNLSGIVVELGM